MLNHFLTFIYDIVQILFVHQKDTRRVLPNCPRFLWIATDTSQEECVWKGDKMDPLKSCPFCYKHSLKFLWLTNWNLYHRRTSARWLQPISLSLVLLYLILWMQLNYMKVISTEWGNKSYDHIIIYFHSALLEDFFKPQIYSYCHSKKATANTNFVLSKFDLAWN